MRSKSKEYVNESVPLRYHREKILVKIAKKPQKLLTIYIMVDVVTQKRKGKRMKKRILSALIAAVMTFTALTATIPAAAEEPAPAASSPETALSVNGANTFGALAADMLNVQNTAQTENDGYGIFDIIMNGNTAGVRLQIKEDCELVVAIYDEEGSAMIASASSLISAEDTAVGLTIDAELPQYYLVRGYLLDPDTGRALCTTFETADYTKVMQDFYALTTADFTEDRVHNFDDDETNNFAVFKENVKVMAKNAGYNKVISVDDEKREYVFGHPDDSFKALKKGDMFSYSYAAIGFIIAEVDSVSYDPVSDTLTIKGADIGMDDAFDVIKINMTAGTQDLVFYEDGQKIRETLLDEELVSSLEPDSTIDLTERTDSDNMRITSEKYLGKISEDGGEFKYDETEIEMCFTGELSVSTKDKLDGAFDMGIKLSNTGFNFENDSAPSFSFLNESEKVVHFKTLKDVKENAFSEVRGSSFENISKLVDKKAYDEQKDQQEKMQALLEEDKTVAVDKDKDKELSFSGSLSMSGTLTIPQMTVKVYKLYNNDRYNTFTINFDVNFDLSVVFSAEANFEVTFLKFSVPMLYAVGIDLGGEVFLSVSLEIEIAFKHSFNRHCEIAIRPDTQELRCLKSDKLFGDAEDSNEFTANGALEIDFGIKLVANIGYGLAEAELPLTIGVAIEAEDTTYEEDHVCHHCWDISLDGKVNVSVQAGALWGILETEVDLFELSFPILCFHLSVRNKGDALQFGTGKCGNYNNYKAYISLSAPPSDLDISAIEIGIYEGQNIAETRADVDTSKLVAIVAPDKDGIITAALEEDKQYHWFPVTNGFIPQKGTFIRVAGVNTQYVPNMLGYQRPEQAYVGKHETYIAYNNQISVGSGELDSWVVDYLDPGEPVTVKLVDGSGAPITIKDGTPVISFESKGSIDNSEGIYDIGKDISVDAPVLDLYLPEGEYTVSADIPRFTLSESSVTVSGSEIVLRFEPKYTFVSIHVKNGEDNVAGARVYVDGLDMTLTNSDGIIETVHMQMIPHTITVELDGEEVYSTTADVGEDTEVIEIDINTSSEKDFRYTINDEKVTIDRYLGTRTNVVIPDMIEGYPVTEIGMVAFTARNLDGSIGGSAFNDYSFTYCANIVSVTIPHSVTSIGNEAFDGCISLKSINTRQCD